MPDSPLPANGTGDPIPMQTLPPPLPPMPPQVRAQVILALKLAGLTRAEIARLLGITVHTLDVTEDRQGSRKALRVIREIAKLEFVESALAVQRKYFQALRDLPADKEHAVAHSRYAGALGVIAEKAALASGEATQRSETTTLTLTLEEKQAMLAQLEQARDLDRTRQGLPPPSEDWWGKYLEGDVTPPKEGESAVAG